MATRDCELDKVAYQMYQEDYRLRQTKILSQKKKEEFKLLVRRAIKNELSEDDATIMKMYFCEGYSQREIALVFGVDKSTINRRIKKSIDVLYEKLKYAVEYRFGIVISDKKKKEDKIK